MDLGEDDFVGSSVMVEQCSNLIIYSGGQRMDNMVDERAGLVIDDIFVFECYFYDILNNRFYRLIYCTSIVL